MPNKPIKPHPCHNNTFHISLIKLLSHAPYQNYYWGINRVSVIFFLIFKLNNIFFLQILLQDKYNIGVLAVNIEFMWLGTKQMERFAKAHLSPVSKPRHINSIFTINTPILYIYYLPFYLWQSKTLIILLYLWNIVCNLDLVMNIADIKHQSINHTSQTQNLQKLFKNKNITSVHLYFHFFPQLFNNRNLNMLNMVFKHHSRSQI
jgi:hypothetical protein